MLNRRAFLLSGASIAALGIASSRGSLSEMISPAAAKAFEVVKSDAEWQQKLTPIQFKVLRKQGTERAFTSSLLKEKRKGTFNCAGCDLPVYSSATKYDSRTGWPSFWQSLDGAVGTSVDRKFFMTRTEVHCARCGGHLGHIFNDGPKPTGKRHCINGVAMTFKPATA